MCILKIIIQNHKNVSSQYKFIHINDRINIKCQAHVHVQQSKYI
jgi:hypothetical protein